MIMYNTIGQAEQEENARKSDRRVYNCHLGYLAQIIIQVISFSFLKRKRFEKHGGD